MIDELGIDDNIDEEEVVDGPAEVEEPVAVKEIKLKIGANCFHIPTNKMFKIWMITNSHYYAKDGSAYPRIHCVRG